MSESEFSAHNRTSPQRRVAVASTPYPVQGSADAGDDAPDGRLLDLGVGQAVRLGHGDDEADADQGAAAGEVVPLPQLQLDRRQHAADVDGVQRRPDRLACRGRLGRG